MNSKILLAISVAANLTLACGVFYCLKQFDRIALLSTAPPVLVTSMRFDTNAPASKMAEPAEPKAAESIVRGG